MLDNWLPFLIYALFAALIPISMLVMSFVFAIFRGVFASKAPARIF